MNLSDFDLLVFIVLYLVFIFSSHTLLPQTAFLPLSDLFKVTFPTFAFSIFIAIFYAYLVSVDELFSYCEEWLPSFKPLKQFLLLMSYVTIAF